MFSKYAMKIWRLFLCYSILFFFSCSWEYEPVEFVFTDKKIEVGGTWVYEHKYINIGADRYPDTMCQYSIAECYADTIIRGKKYYCFKETYYNQGFFEIDTFITWFHVHYGTDSVIVLNTKNQGILLGTLFGIGKRGGFPQKYLFNHRRTSGNSNFYSRLYEKTEFYSITGSRYDSSAFSDCYYPLTFPLEPGQVWYYRPPKDPNGNLPIKRKYLGKEIIGLPRGPIETWKLEWDWSPSFLDEFGLIGYDWWTEFGIVKRYFDIGTCTTTILDKYGVWIDDVVESYEINSFLEESPLVIPKLKTIISKEQLDAAILTVSQYWDFIVFRTWCDTCIKFCAIRPEYQVQLENLHYEIDYVIFCVWGDTTVPFSSQINYLQTHVLPLNADDFHYYNGFLRFVVSSPFIVQGWKDCDFNWRVNDKPFTDTTDMVFLSGKSKMRDELDNNLFNFSNR